MDYLCLVCLLVSTLGLKEGSFWESLIELAAASCGATCDCFSALNAILDW